MIANFYIDANVILDLLDKKRISHNHSKKLLQLLIENEKIDLFISSDMISNIFYILQNSFKLDLEKSLEIIENLTKIFDIVTVDRYDIIKAINLCKNNIFKDYEDALQYVCALKTDVVCLISNDKKGFKNSSIKVYSSLEFLNQNLSE